MVDCHPCTTLFLFCGTALSNQAQFLLAIASCLQGAFSRAHEASLNVYDDPPNAVTYPFGNL